MSNKESGVREVLADRVVSFLLEAGERTRTNQMRRGTEKKSENDIFWRPSKTETKY